MRNIEIVSGLAFFLPRSSLDSHLWFVLSDPENFPDDDVVCVNVTTFDSAKPIEDVYNDPTCQLNRGDHPFINRLSCICYEGFRDSPGGMISGRELASRLNNGDQHRQFRPHGTNASPELLQRMRDGATVSDHMTYGAEEVLQVQGLV